MKFTRTDLEQLTRDELINLVLQRQQAKEPHIETTLYQTKKNNDTTNAIEADTINAESLFAWFLTIKRGDYVLVTKRDITEHFNCTTSDYSKYMRELFNNGLLIANMQQGKKIISSYKILK